MAKSIRSKIKKRFRTAKRIRVLATVEKARRAELSANIAKVAAGTRESDGQPKNAFLHPYAEGAEIPMASIKEALDFRASANPAVFNVLPRIQY